ncbi:hypothetical protein N7474_000380 [Penicillium riverlandense]|uniref:uncharacterized protein n=1 Tax=Penicillium riverlandense TaxID=1903569 RepID=UPI002547CE19|nr:uncharacterized protein N7474_000380 [Penicillium riverlandense]KAJ5832069.1 hypothetical protein N7474_000380 [Penicillium riverlandense]
MAIRCCGLNILKEGHNEERNIIFVLAGWDRLTTNSVNFVDLFAQCANLGYNVRTRVYVDDPLVSTILQSDALPLGQPPFYWFFSKE